MEVDAVVLAAGRSSRMGSPKVLLPAGPGETLLSRVLGLAAGIPQARRILLIVGRAQAIVAAEAQRWLDEQDPKPNLIIVPNPDFASGMSTSLVSAIRASSQNRPLLILLADQPLVPAEELAILMRAAEHRPEGVHSVSLSFGGPRPPAIVDPSIFPDFIALKGDLGVRTVLSEKLAGVMLFPPKISSGYVDIDDWEIYSRTAQEQGWDNEEVRLESRYGGRLPKLVEQVVERAMRAKPATYTAPGVIFAASYQPIQGPNVSFVPGYLLPNTGLKAAIVAQTLTPLEYINGLRQTTLWALHNYQ